jgi:hypothetical protein
VSPARGRLVRPTQLRGLIPRRSAMPLKVPSAQCSAGSSSGAQRSRVWCSTRMALPTPGLTPRYRRRLTSHRRASKRPSGRTGGPQQGITDRALLRVAGKAMLMPVQATVHGVLGGLLAFGIDIAAVDSNCGRAHKPGVCGRGLVADMMVRTSASRWRSARTRWTSASAAGKFGQCSTYRTSITRPGS